MRKLLLSIVLLTFAITATAQEMAKQQAESLTTYLSLDATQKEAVYQLYKTTNETRNQKREAVVAANKPSKEVRLKREKLDKAKKPRPEKKQSAADPKRKTSSPVSDRLLLITHKQTESNPSLLGELKKILTQQQYTKWQAIGKK
ncbi:MAG: hypothetical protein COB30_013465 [Ectothiorhodospiraceae bacterium]|nr:hypothetical protein [Ectothiorhodospiraceae bacterium]